MYIPLHCIPYEVIVLNTRICCVHFCLQTQQKSVQLRGQGLEETRVAVPCQWRLLHTWPSSGLISQQLHCLIGLRSQSRLVVRLSSLSNHRHYRRRRQAHVELGLLEGSQVTKLIKYMLSRPAKAMFLQILNGRLVTTSSCNQHPYFHHPISLSNPSWIRLLRICKYRTPALAPPARLGQLQFNQRRPPPHQQTAENAPLIL